MVLAMPDGTSIALTFRHCVGLKPFIMPGLHFYSSLIFPWCQGCSRLNNTRSYSRHILWMDRSKQSICAFPQYIRSDAQQALHLLADKQKPMRLTIRA